MGGLPVVLACQDILPGEEITMRYTQTTDGTEKSPYPIGKGAAEEDCPSFEVEWTDTSIRTYPTAPLPVPLRYIIPRDHDAAKRLYEMEVIPSLPEIPGVYSVSNLLSLQCDSIWKLKGYARRDTKLFKKKVFLFNCLFSALVGREADRVSKNIRDYLTRPVDPLLVSVAVNFWEQVRDATDDIRHKFTVREDDFLKKCHSFLGRDGATTEDAERLQRLRFLTQTLQDTIDHLNVREIVLHDDEIEFYNNPHILSVVLTELGLKLGCTL